MHKWIFILVQPLRYTDKRKHLWYFLMFESWFSSLKPFSFIQTVLAQHVWRHWLGTSSWHQTQIFYFIFWKVMFDRAQKRSWVTHNVSWYARNGITTLSYLNSTKFFNLSIKGILLHCLSLVKMFFFSFFLLTGIQSERKLKITMRAEERSPSLGAAQ